VRLFLDTANIDEIRKGAELGVITGVTTNPSLAAKEGIGTASLYRDSVLEICEIVDGPISVEVVSLEAEAMIEEGWGISQWHPNVVVKLPSTGPGFQAMSQLSRENVKINQTLCFSVNQALLGSQAGSTYVSPFIGRLDDAGHDGIGVVASIVKALGNFDLPTQVLAASIRHPLHCVNAALAGAHAATIPFKVLEQMVKHPMTTAGLDSFTQDWERAAGQNTE
jgi:transaldolase